LASYTRLIEFKVKDTELSRAVNKLSKTLTSIDKTLIGIDKKLDHIAKQGFGYVAKEATKAERSVTKLGRAMKNVPKSIGGSLLGNIGGKKGEIARRVAELTAFDGVLRKITNGSTGLPAFSKRVTEASTALTAFGIAHWGAITGITAGSLAIVKGTRFFYDLGKGARQAEASLIDFIRTYKQVGIKGAASSLFPKGSHLGGNKESLSIPKAAAAETLTGQSSNLYRQSLRSLESRRTLLTNNKRIQEGLVALTGKHLQASIQVKRSQFQYNLELVKTRLVQSAVTADIWAAQKAWQGVVGTLKGAKNLIGGLFGGKFGGIGQAAGVIGLSRGIEVLTGKLGFLNNQWINNARAASQWATRVTEAVATVNIAYTGLTKVLGAASWTIGAIAGFKRWENEAAQAIWRIDRQAKTLAQSLGAAFWMMQGKGGTPSGVAQNIKNLALGGEERQENIRYQGQGPTTLQTKQRELELQTNKLKQRNISETDYIQILKKQTKLKSSISRIEDSIRTKQVEAGQFASSVFKDEYDEFQRVTKQKQKDLASLERQEKKARADVQKAAGKQYEADLKAIKDKEAEVIKSEQKIQAAKLRLAKQTASRQRSIEQQRSQDAARFRENMMLGAGFPLLFGGGIGSVAGGVTGAALSGGGKGFGAQILLSAIGQQIDAFIGKVRELGEAFKKPTENIEALITAAGQKNRPIGDMAKKMEELGMSAQASEILLSQFNLQFGKLTDKSFKELGDESTELSNQLAILGTSISILVAGPLASFIKTINEGLSGPQGDIDSAVHLFRKGEGSRGGPRTKAVLDEQFKKITGQTVKDLIDNKIPQSILESPEFKNSVRRFLDDVADPGGAEGRRNRDLNMATAGQLIEGARGSEISELEAKLQLEKQRKTLTEQEYQIKQKAMEIDQITDQIDIAQLERAATERMGLDTKELDHKIKVLGLTKEIAEAELKNLKTGGKLEEMYKSIAVTIEDGLVNAIEGAIQGTRTLGQVASSVLSQIANKMLKLGVNKLLTMIPGVGDLFKADGGPVSGGSPYIVGEKGPELFVPKSSGNIVPNHAMGGSMVVNVDASGSSAEGDDDRSRQLGELIGAAVQSEIIRQQRPGGTLY